MDRVVNLKMLAHPLNWAIVWVVLTFAGVAWSLFHDAAHRAPIGEN